jgi:hypothetical protein
MAENLRRTGGVALSVPRCCQSPTTGSAPVLHRTANPAGAGRKCVRRLAGRGRDKSRLVTPGVAPKGGCQPPRLRLTPESIWSSANHVEVDWNWTLVTTRHWSSALATARRRANWWGPERVARRCHAQRRRCRTNQAHQDRPVAPGFRLSVRRALSPPTTAHAPIHNVPAPRRTPATR